MQKKAKKILCTILVIGILSSALAGCSNATKSNKAASNQGSKVTISFVEWNPLPKDNFVTDFMKKYPNIKVNVINVPDSQYSQKINTMISSGSEPDVMLLWENDFAKFSKLDKLTPLDQYVSRSDSSIKEDDLIPAVKEIQDINGGKIYGLPWCYASEILYYNKDMFDKAHVPYPTDQWTWEDFTSAAQKLTIVKDGKTIQWGADDFTQPGLWFSTIGAAGDDMISKDGKMHLGDGAKKALQWQYDLVNKYKVVPPPSANSQASDLFLAGKAAMTRAGSWMIGTYRDIKDFKWDIAPLPKGVRQYSSLHTGFFTISKDSKNKDAAWKFINYCMSEEGQTAIEKMFSNPSTVLSIQKEGAYKVQGINGPTNWAALDETAQFGRFGFVLAPTGLTNDMVSKFQAAVLGQISIDEAIKECNEEAANTSN